MVRQRQSSGEDKIGTCAVVRLELESHVYMEMMKQGTLNLKHIVLSSRGDLAHANVFVCQFGGTQ